MLECVLDYCLRTSTCMLMHREDVYFHANKQYQTYFEKAKSPHFHSVLPIVCHS